jgi:hypothetical protein
LRRFSALQALGFVVLVAGTVVYGQGDAAEVEEEIAGGVYDADVAAAAEDGGAAGARPGGCMHARLFLLALHCFVAVGCIKCAAAARFRLPSMHAASWAGAPAAAAAADGSSALRAVPARSQRAGGHARALPGGRHPRGGVVLLQELAQHERVRLAAGLGVLRTAEVSPGLGLERLRLGLGDGGRMGGRACPGRSGGAATWVRFVPSSSALC